MGQLRDKMIEDLKLKGSSAETKRAYLSCARAFAAHYHRSPSEMGEAEVRQFLLFLVDEKKVKTATHRMYVAALCFLYRTTLARPRSLYTGSPICCRRRYISRFQPRGAIGVFAFRQWLSCITQMFLPTTAPGPVAFRSPIRVARSTTAPMTGCPANFFGRPCQAGRVTGASKRASH